MGFNILMVGSTRVCLRLYRDYIRNSRELVSEQVTPVVIIGAGSAGNQIAREILKSIHHQYRLIGFIDDQARLKSQRIHNIPIIGEIHELALLSRQYGFQQVLIAMPSVTGNRLREILAICDAAKVTAKVLPGMLDILGGRVSMNQFREVQIDDLLRREPVNLDNRLISGYLSDAVIVVTGAGGSIGSELCRQIAQYSPKQLIMIDHSEFSMYTIENELRGSYNSLSYVAEIFDVTNKVHLSGVFETYRPDIVFHAAAYKHVPLMEHNILSLIHNNIKGTQNVFETAITFQVKRVVLISTDKAVNPTNCMGASKRICEMMLQMYHQQSSSTSFSAVRFGNVLGSHGSVVPLFKSQIKSGGPLTITHPEITRYFMTIPEAVGLVMQCGSYSNGGEIYILDMGKPIKIIDLAYDLIQLSGLQVGTDITIQTVGLRPGEKMFEELSYSPHLLTQTRHPKIFVAPPIEFEVDINDVDTILSQKNAEGARDALFKFIQSDVNAKV
jgi:FlaA1/EpsC-like NDP-sugar epimerase